jgi:hypothetical protein
MRTILAAALLALLPFAHAAPAAEETAFLHEGVIEANIPAAITLDLRFRLFTAATGGAAVGEAALTEDVRVLKRSYTVLLDFGVEVFDGEPRWLEVAFRPANSTGAFLTLPARQQLFPVPAALHSLTATRLLGPLPAAQLPPEAARLDADQTFTGAVTFAPAAGAPFAVGSTNVVPNLNADRLDGLEAAAFWQLGGNAGTTPGANFLGTTDNAPLELRVNGERVALFLPDTNSPNIVLGSPLNSIAPGASGALVLGGGGLGVGEFGLRRTNQYPNVVLTNFGIIVGGQGNTNAALLAFIGGGAQNRIRASADYGTFIGGGVQNLIESNSSIAIVVGGHGNRVLRSSGGFIGGGSDNLLSNSVGSVIVGGALNQMKGTLNGWSFIGGGFQNTIVSRGTASTIGGGTQNSITNARIAVIGGGSGNIINSNADFAVIPGGAGAQAESYGQFAFASGAFPRDNRPGGAQTSTFVQRCITTNDVPGRFTTGSTNIIRLRQGSHWAFDALVTAGTTNGLTAGFHLRGVIKNLGGVTTLVGTPALSALGSDSGAEGWTVTAEADDARDALILRATGSQGHLIRWVATVRTAELIY